MIPIRTGLVGALLAATAVGVSACGAAHPAGMSPTLPSAKVPHASAPLALGGTSWLIVKIKEASRVVAVPAAANAFVTFGPNGTASGSDSVNNWSGRYSIHGQRIHFESVATTQIGLAASAPAYHKATMSAVSGIMRSGSVTATRAGTSLILRLGSGSIYLRRIA